ncbi:protein SODIUM POTASSIUM ROOT DEFECTIVE 3 [Lycium barbarum]|uniref:protein SODIUM POTASSIUM ROOT DEFECTIVE 3 n=1 Tax=Lycium barbarum TaxID=112863 RepID=UPI00293ED321|nr:protein SODIUM POTASSIUM ROOT DEFECTIVE 3 [Lycium barbarum]
MKGIDIFCASQASTSICLSMEEASSSSSSVIHIGGGSISASRLIDRHNPIIRDSRRIGGSDRVERPLPPCSSQQPVSPKPKKKNNNKKSSTTSSKASIETNKKKANNNDHKGHFIKRSSWSCTKPGEFITPPSSSRYLLSEKDLFDALSDYDDPVLKLVNSKSCKDVKVAADESSTPKPPSSLSSSPSKDQVVVLRVSLHCRGCEKKMRKHLSRMQGVTSFNIDFAAKKVEVIGDVTPLEVLASISKVKNAQLWPPTLS